MPRVSAVLPNYNGGKMLAGTVRALLQTTIAESDLVVVDDASTDDSIELLREESPAIRSVTRASNGGFSATANEGLRAADGEFVVLLNSDVEVTPDFLDPILPLFEDATVFGVTCRIITPSLGGLDDGAKTAVWHHGMVWPDSTQDVSEVKPVFFASGCASVYRRSMLEELDGFDEAYSPFYWEDVDLSYRAWKRGWKSLYQPASTVYHQHSATTSKLPRSFTDRIKARNSLFFIWRNISDEQLLRKHRKWLPLVLAKRLALRDRAFVLGWHDAFLRRREAVEARRRDDVFRQLSDRQIFDTLGIEVVAS